MTPVRNLSYVRLVDEIRAELQALADEVATHIERRNAAVLRAREAHMTWPEIGAILGVTPHGLRKTLDQGEH